jgi:nucleotidyltransferase substrate binding protein (TIGR01987 family)
MEITAISLEPLQRALQSLEEALAQPKNEFTRDASIQRFEYTFELCWKVLKRYIEAVAGLQEYNIKDLFRAAGKLGLIESVEN